METQNGNIEWNQREFKWQRGAKRKYTCKQILFYPKFQICGASKKSSYTRKLNIEGQGGYNTFSRKPLKKMRFCIDNIEI